MRTTQWVKSVYLHKELLRNEQTFFFETRPIPPAQALVAHSDSIKHTNATNKLNQQQTKNKQTNLTNK